MTKSQLLKLKTFAAICKAEGKDESDYDLSKVDAAWQKAAMCLRKLKLICKPFNGKDKPNVANTDQRKNYPWAWIEPAADDDNRPFGVRLSFSVCDFALTLSNLGARPYLLDSSYVKHVFDNFQKEYEEWMYWENMTFQEE